MITITTLLNSYNYPNAKANDLQFEIDQMNKALSVMHDGLSYRCRDLVGMIKGCATYQAVGVVMNRLYSLGLVDKIKIDGQPIEIEVYECEEVTINGVTFVSTQKTFHKKTIIPKITVYRKKCLAK